MITEEGVYQRVREADNRNDRYEPSASNLPEWRPRKVFAPEDLPAGNGPPVNIETLGELTDSAWCWPLPHGTDEDHAGGDEDLAAEEAYRWWCDSLAAALAIAAEAQPDTLLFRLRDRDAAWLTGVVGAMQASAT